MRMKEHPWRSQSSRETTPVKVTIYQSQGCGIMQKKRTTFHEKEALIIRHSKGIDHPRCLDFLFLALLLTIVICSSSASASSQFISEAISQYNAGHYDEALHLLGAAEGSDFNNPTLHYYLANCLARLNQKDGAIKEYKLTLDLLSQAHLEDSTIASYCQMGIKSLIAPPQSSALPSAAVRRKMLPTADDAETELAEVVVALSDNPSSKQMQANVSAVQKQFEPRVVFNMIRQDTSDRAAQRILEKYKISEYPTTLFFDKEGNLTLRKFGLVDQDSLYQAISGLARRSKGIQFRTPFN
jgi:tetratricopeptide (TPR) repeat protein